MKMKKLIFVEGIFPINTRSERLINTLAKKFEVKIIAWDRKSIYSESMNNYYVYSSNEGYGKKIKKLLGMIKYFIFIKKILLKEKFNTIVVSQWDMLLLVYFLKKKDIKLIYDNIDMPSSNSKIITYMLKKIERVCLRKVDMMIYASRFFKENYNFFKRKTYILENLPMLINYKNIPKKLENDYINIGFVGTVRYFDILKNLLNLTRWNKCIKVSIWGDGPDLNKVKKYIEDNKLTNIFLYGKYNYRNIEKIYTTLDFIWAAYPNKDENVKYAISNKFFESLLYMTPGIFSENTKLGELVEKNQIGITIDPYQSFESVFTNMCIVDFKYRKIKYLDNILKYKIRTSLFWEDKEMCILEMLDKLEI